MSNRQISRVQANDLLLKTRQRMETNRKSTKVKHKNAQILFSTTSARARETASCLKVIQVRVLHSEVD